MTSNPTKRNSSYKVNVLAKTFQILEAFSDNREEAGVAELITRLHIPKSTVHRLVIILERHGYLERSPQSGKYHLGWKLIHLGMLALSNLDLAKLAVPHLERLATQTGETAHLGVLRQGEIISLFHAQGRHVLRPPSTVGSRVPPYCTSLGKAIMAFLAQEEADDLIKGFLFKEFTPKTITRSSSLRNELKRVRELGYAVDNEEFEEGLKCIGAPVRNHTGRVIAAISIAMPSFRMKKDRSAKLARLVKKNADDLSSALGYRERPRPSTNRRRSESGADRSATVMSETKPRTRRQ